MDWRDCPEVQIRADVHGGAPVLRGTRLTVEDSILGNLDAGVEESELVSLFPSLNGKTRELKAIISYARKQMNVPHPV